MPWGAVVAGIAIPIALEIGSKYLFADSDGDSDSDDSHVNYVAMWYKAARFAVDSRSFRDADAKDLCSLSYDSYVSGFGERISTYIGIARKRDELLQKRPDLEQLKELEPVPPWYSDRVMSGDKSLTVAQWESIRKQLGCPPGKGDYPAQKQVSPSIAGDSVTTDREVATTSTSGYRQTVSAPLSSRSYVGYIIAGAVVIGAAIAFWPKKTKKRGRR